MRSAACLLAAVVCSSLHAQNKIDAIEKPPPPTNVYVLNFPEVQAVEGSVVVTNLPAVQTVGGTVNLGNLPLDADGALRVTSAPVRQMVWHELLPTPGEHTDYTLPVTVDTKGYGALGLSVTTVPPHSDVVSKLAWRWSEDEPFEEIGDYRWVPPSYSPCVAGHMDGKMVCASIGGTVQISVSASPGVVFTSVKLHLIR